MGSHGCGYFPAERDRTLFVLRLLLLATEARSIQTQEWQGAAEETRVAAVPDLLWSGDERSRPADFEMICFPVRAYWSLIYWSLQRWEWQLKRMAAEVNPLSKWSVATGSWESPAKCPVHLCHDIHHFDAPDRRFSLDPTAHEPSHPRGARGIDFDGSMSPVVYPSYLFPGD